jgi:hypothetical protein
MNINIDGMIKKIKSLTKKNKLPEEEERYNLKTPLALWALDVRFRSAEKQMQKMVKYIS